MILYSLFFRCRKIFKSISKGADSIYAKSISLPFEKKALKEIPEYLSKAATPKLHIGCGSNIIDTWLNTDILVGKNTTYLDVTKKFPLPDNTFNFIFSEHMIEHITLPQAQVMLKESLRVLKPGGVIRITTPDMAKILPLYKPDLSEEQLKYLDWAEKTHIEKPLLDIHNHYINNYFHSWGHQFIYDFNSMKKLLELIGFINIREVQLYKSTHLELDNLELHHKVISMEYTLLESFAVEASKQ